MISTVPAKSTDLQPPADLQALFQEAFSLHQRGKLSVAQALYGQVLDVLPEHFNALLFSGILAAQLKASQQAVTLIRQALALNPEHAAAHYSLGNALADLLQHQEAAESFAQAIRFKPDFAAAHNNRGIALHESQQYRAALECFAEAIRLNPDFALAHNNQGHTLLALRQRHDALDSFEHAIRLNPGYAEAHNNRGYALRDLHRPQDAADSFTQAIQLNPRYAEAHNNLGNALIDLKQLDAALANFDKAIELNPKHPAAYYNKGNALRDLNLHTDAVSHYDQALHITPDFAKAYCNKGFSLLELRQHKAAIASYEKALELEPNMPFLFGELLHTKMHICDWRGLDASLAELALRLERCEKVASPLTVVGLIDSPELQKKAAEIWVQHHCPVNETLGPVEPHAPKPPPARIRIGYYSADFHNHATAYLTAELFETHDKASFELIAFSYGPDKDDQMRRRIRSAFDQFIDVRDQTDVEVARLSRQLGIDIAVDLKGFTAGGRLGIFATRAAPVQVSYLGYPGTMGAVYFDYLIADRVVIPTESQVHYSEKILYLPGCYQVNDSQRKISAAPVCRADMGLPEKGFVYCCFNNSYKITPCVFDSWMRILQQVEQSVLWLLEDNAVAAQNLCFEAERRGIQKNRLIFAKRVPLEAHLARHRLADLFLDTYPYNAHTTASDALWAGLPILTCAGQGFASRVSSSLLCALNLSEFITPTRQAYEALAVQLADDAERLNVVREAFKIKILTADLFTAKSFSKYLEIFYKTI